MAKGQQQQQPAHPRSRTYKGSTGEMISLEPGKSFTGTFQGAKEITITDRKTHEDKQVMRYSFRDENGKRFVILGAVQLDVAFEEVFEGEGGQEKCLGLMVKIERGEDMKLPGKRTMGTYEVSVWEE